MALLSVKRLATVLSAVRAIDPTMPVQGLACFLEIAAHEGMGVNELSASLGIASSSASRNVSSLSDWHYRKKPGLGLVRLEVDPTKLCRKQIFLTDKGKALIEQINLSLEGI